MQSMHANVSGPLSILKNTTLSDYINAYMESCLLSAQAKKKFVFFSSILMIKIVKRLKKFNRATGLKPHSTLLLVQCVILELWY